MEPRKHETAPEPASRAPAAASRDVDPETGRPPFEPAWFVPSSGPCGIQRSRGGGRTTTRVNVPDGVDPGELTHGLVDAFSRQPMPGSASVPLGEMPVDRDVLRQPITGSLARSRDGSESTAVLDARRGHTFAGRDGSLAGISMHGHPGPPGAVDVDKESYGEVRPGLQPIREGAARMMDTWDALRAFQTCMQASRPPGDGPPGGTGGAPQ